MEKVPDHKDHFEEIDEEFGIKVAPAMMNFDPQAALYNYRPLTYWSRDLGPAPQFEKRLTGFYSGEGGLNPQIAMVNYT